MDPITRELLRKKHEKHLAEEASKAEVARLAEEALEAERLEAEQTEATIKEIQRIEDELKATEANTTIDVFFAELSDTMTSLSEVPDLPSVLEILACRIDSVILIIKSNNRIDELNTIITGLVEILNKMHEDTHKSAENVKQIKEAVQYIFNICGIEIEIEAMDTSEDEKAALRAQSEEYADHGEHPFHAAGGNLHEDEEGMPPLEAP